jgi:DNA-binding GntR family transcriptional regulator
VSKSQIRSTNSSLHEIVRAEIQKRVSTQVYAPGTAIPSTSMLSEEFDVSPITIKRALRDLQSAGLLTSTPGKGTYVKEQRRFLRELDVWMSSMDNARKLGFEPTMELVSITREKINDPTMEVFNPPAEAVLCVRKLILADGVPIMYDATFLSAELDSVIVDEFAERFVTDALHRHDVDVTNTRLVIDAAPASLGAQQAFSVPNGYPVLRRLYHITTTRPGISVFGIVESPFDRLACSVNLAGPALPGRAINESGNA